MITRGELSDDYMSEGTVMITRGWYSNDYDGRVL